MRVSMKYFLPAAVLSLAVASTAARADLLTFIPSDFNPALSSGNDNAAMVSYSQDGYLIVPGDTSSPATTTKGQFDENYFQGNPAPGLSSGGVIGDTVSSFTISDGSSLVSLTSFSLDPVVGSVSWSIYNGSTLLKSGTDSTLGSYSTISSGLTSQYSSLTIQFSDPGSTSDYNVDNINVTPEPSSIMLLGTGLVGLGGLLRRRILAA